MSTRATIIVAGALANKPANSGEAWVRLSWVRGLERMGFDVLLFEQIDPDTCADAAGRPAPFERSVNLAWFDRITADFGLRGRAALIRSDKGEAHGMPIAETRDAADAAILLVNISGHLAIEDVTRRVRCRAYVDIDPGFTQFWHAAGTPGARLQGHHQFFTVGENIGSARCPIPSSGFHWKPVRQPIVLDDWPMTAMPDPASFTTVASWRGPFGRIESGGRRYGLKLDEFRRFMNIPACVPGPFEIALDIHTADAADRETLRRHGWNIVDPAVVAAHPHDFRRYVQRSLAEFSVAKGIYVQTRSGWFSDRTVRYLASGRPALVQDTGFDRTLPTGEGLLAFHTLADAVRGAEQIAIDPSRHSQAARSIAEEYFDSDRVLADFLERTGVAP